MNSLSRLHGAGIRKCRCISPQGVGKSSGCSCTGTRSDYIRFLAFRTRTRRTSRRNRRRRCRRTFCPRIFRCRRHTDLQDTRAFLKSSVVSYKMLFLEKVRLILPHPLCSSDRSKQSYSPSHSKCLGRHPPERHLIRIY